MTERNSRAPGVTPLQQAILEVLWAGGPSTADAIREALHPKHPLKDSSVRTMLRRLETRGYVTHTLDGKVFVYSAAQRPHRIAAKAVRQIIERLCSGSVEQFLLGMVDEKVLSAKEIQRLAKRVRSHK
ncbi:MAG TPA: BlaI/MecI/CopY family transcriptional regulator [Vicinamibacterales bacterium]|jgi:predicted transcriptional regulator|nr:BlaI/MecI/CopY family transcriptional regulator [Vicinamibacterales bacterium]